jgi:hypothetical protein
MGWRAEVLDIVIRVHGDHIALLQQPNPRYIFRDIGGTEKPHLSLRIYSEYQMRQIDIVYSWYDYLDLEYQLSNPYTYGDRPKIPTFFAPLPIFENISWIWMW